MSFMLRAAVVIGVLSYLAAQRGGAGDEIRALAANPGEQIAALAGAVPREIREPATQALVSELTLRLKSEAASRDTLSAGDRRAPWRGAENR